MTSSAPPPPPWSGIGTGLHGPPAYRVSSPTSHNYSHNQHSNPTAERNLTNHPHWSSGYGSVVAVPLELDARYTQARWQSASLPE